MKKKCLFGTIVVFFGTVISVLAVKLVKNKKKLIQLERERNEIMWKFFDDDEFLSSEFDEDDTL